MDEIYAKFSKGYHTYQSVTLPFNFFALQSYDTGQHYPLVVCLHGSGERGDSPDAVKKNRMAVVWARDSNQSRWPCFILVPQCPTGGSWVNLYGLGSYSTGTIPIRKELLAVLDLLDSLIAIYPVDTNRIYVTGLSMGGFGTWDLIVRYPDRFAAAVPMSGAGDTSRASLIKDVPVWNFHGALDNVVPATGSREMMHAIERAGESVVYTHCHDGDCTGLPDWAIAAECRSGAKHLYTEYQNGQHTIWDDAYNTNFLLPWVFSKSRADRVVGVHSAESSSIPKQMELFQNYPNPFNPTTMIEFTISKLSTVDLRIFDLLGRKVVTLENEQRTPGNYSVKWDASDLPSGVYFYQLRAGPFVQTRMLVLVK